MTEPSEFDVTSERIGDRLLVSPRGEIDLATAGIVDAALRDLPDGTRTLVLDLRDVPFLDTSGVRLIVEALHRSTAQAFRFTVVRGPRTVQRVLDVSGITDELDLVDDPRQATE